MSLLGGLKSEREKKRDKSTFKTAIRLSGARGLHVREKLLLARDIFRTVDEGKRLGDNLEREAEEINPGRLKRETRR
jgi:hypothetical protein